MTIARCRNGCCKCETLLRPGGDFAEFFWGIFPIHCPLLNAHEVPGRNNHKTRLQRRQFLITISKQSFSNHQKKKKKAHLYNCFGYPKPLSPFSGKEPGKCFVSTFHPLWAPSYIPKLPLRTSSAQGCCSMRG